MPLSDVLALDRDGLLNVDVDLAESITYTPDGGSVATKSARVRAREHGLPVAGQTGSDIPQLIDVLLSTDATAGVDPDTVTVRDKIVWQGNNYMVASLGGISYTAGFFTLTAKRIRKRLIGRPDYEKAV